MVNDFLVFLIFCSAMVNPMMGKRQLGDRKQRAAMPNQGKCDESSYKENHYVWVRTT